MPLSTDVNLPRDFPARYPARCVRCNGDHQGQTIRIWTHSIGWWTFLFWWFGWGVSTRTPACSPCAWRIRLERLGGMFFTIVITIAFLAFVWPHFDDLVSRPFRKWVAMGAILLCLSPYFLWATFFYSLSDSSSRK